MHSHRQDVAGNQTNCRLQFMLCYGKTSFSKRCRIKIIRVKYIGSLVVLYSLILLKGQDSVITTNKYDRETVIFRIDKEHS